MAIKFKNIRSDEVRVAESEPMIAAMFNSSNLGPNEKQGQDFGWRLAPEVVIEMKRIRRDRRTMESIAFNSGRALQDIDDKEILKYISDKTSVEDAPVAEDGDYEDYDAAYNAEIMALEKKEIEKSKPKPKVEEEEKAKKDTK